MGAGSFDKIISIHAPREGGDLLDPHLIHLHSYFNPRPPRGGRLFCNICACAFWLFQSTPPARGATLDSEYPQLKGKQFQSTPPARGATIPRHTPQHPVPISIHAPREGGDVCGVYPAVCQRISIHAPREGGDWAFPVSLGQLLYFNPRPPRGGRPFHVLCPLNRSDISIHAPREGGDTHQQPDAARPPISIHAPREGGDFVHFCLSGSPDRISIHAPREGGDTMAARLTDRQKKFQSTPPARGATAKMHSFTRGSLTNK